MSLYGMMRTSVSGMQAQASRLSAVADNIANTDTTGFKRYSTEFSQLVRPGRDALNSSQDNSGGVISDLRQSVTQAGSLRYTQSQTDLAINGAGFFVVQDANGAPYMTRAGSFVPDDEGFLVNTAGLRLAGYDVQDGAAAPVANGYAGLVPVTISQTDLIATPTTQGVFQANLPSEADIVAGDTPANNTLTTDFTQKSSLAVYGSLGETKLIDIYFTKTGANQWEVTTFNADDSTAGGPFPYASAPLSTDTITFDPLSGELAAASADTISFTIPGGETMDLSLEGMTQLATDFYVADARTNGNAPEPIDGIDIDSDGTLYARYGDGTFRELFKIPLATVTSPDNLQAQTGSVFLESAESGDVQIGFASEGVLGSIVTGALEQSNVDIAEELTTMIQSQRSYTANSKAFQTGSDLLDVLVNLKR
ncbi:MAG: flagellar hook protein FlgE [Ahrensia sp.]|nr:flagellar hook protein FlgE [Ahrensia sp.]